MSRVIAILTAATLSLVAAAPASPVHRDAATPVAAAKKKRPKPCAKLKAPKPPRCRKKPAPPPPPPPPPPTGARIAARIPVPNDGTVTFAEGAVWVIDRADGAVDAAGVAKGALYRVDPSTNAIADRIDGVIGGSIAVAGGAAWVASPGLDRLLRVDLATKAVVRIATGPAGDLPSGVAVTPGAVWVSNHHGGTVSRVDPETLRLVARVPAYAEGATKPQFLAPDPRGVWVGLSDEPLLLHIDAATNTLGARVDIGGANECTCGGTASEGERVWIAAGIDGHDLVAIDSATGAIDQRITISGVPTDVAVGLGSIWAITSASELLRIDPTTGRVVGTLKLPATATFTGLEIGAGAVWVRVVGALLRVEPT
jgi:DNA-binding beta-propeller fold protein YncE